MHNLFLENPIQFCTANIVLPIPMGKTVFVMKSTPLLKQNIKFQLNILFLCIVRKILKHKNY